jgi:transcriptional regulator with XRE-family HTH domain
VAVGSPPTVRRRQLGRELRRLREEANVPGEELARMIRCSPSRISRIETAQIKIAPGTVHEILDALDADPASRERLVQLAWDAESSPRSRRYDTLSRPVTTFFSLESEATSLRSFEPTVIHGLLQEDGYVRAVTRHWHKDDRAFVEFIVESRRTRYENLTKPSPLDLHVVLDEATLHRQVGGPGVLATQLKWLIEQAELPNVHIQVVPFEAGMHSGPSGSFNILGFGNDQELDVVYVENNADHEMLLERQTKAYRDTFERLCDEALDEPRSLALIAARLSQLRNDTVVR